MTFVLVALLLGSMFRASVPQLLQADDQQTMLNMVAEPRNIVVIGGGAIGCSTAYYLTRHRLFNADSHSVIILEAGKIAGGSSGKAGGFIADWATPKCLAPLSFKAHRDLAQEHDGDKRWGFRLVHAAEIGLHGRNLEHITASNGESIATYPRALDWLAPGAVQSYNEIGTPENSGQVSPYPFTTALARLAQDKGVKVVRGTATSVNYDEDKTEVKSVSYRSKDGGTHTLEATDVVVAAGPWTPNILPNVNLLAPRGHSVVVKPTRDLSSYILFPNISAAPDSSLGKLLSPDIYPRPSDDVFEFDTVYSSGPDDYSVGLPDSTDSVEVDDKQVQDVIDSIVTVSQELHDGKVLVSQACYKPQIRKHEEDEEVGPMVGPMGIKGLWLATGHDEWGIQNSLGTGIIMSEMLLEGEAKSANVSSLDPKIFINI